MSTVAPSAANASAIASPIPRLAPVTRAILFSSRFKIVLPRLGRNSSLQMNVPAELLQQVHSVPKPSKLQCLSNWHYAVDCRTVQAFDKCSQFLKG